VGCLVGQIPSSPRHSSSLKPSKALSAEPVIVASAAAARLGFSFTRWSLNLHEPLHELSAGANSDGEVANRDVRDFGWEVAPAFVSRRPPISLDTIVARTHMYTYAAKVWDLSIV
jgi:hypothetical protein